MPTKRKNKGFLYIGLGIAAAGIVLGLLLLLGGAPAETDTGQETTLPRLAESEFTTTDFVYDGDYLTCTTRPSVLGIDVSTYQKQIDWQQVKAAGVEFVMIRLGYRGSVEGLLFEDEWAQTHYRGAKEAGLKIGAYFFTQSISVAEAVEDARYAMQLLKGWELDMPLVYDWEFLQEDYRNAHVDARLLTDMAKAFCETVEQEGYHAMIYFNASQSRQQMYLQELTDYGFWLAMYSDEMTYEYKIDMWQYTDSGSVPGIEGSVDINLYFPPENK